MPDRNLWFEVADRSKKPAATPAFSWAVDSRDMESGAEAPR
jgi:hypothetical protein